MSEHSADRISALIDAIERYINTTVELKLAQEDARPRTAPPASVEAARRQRSERTLDAFEQQKQAQVTLSQALYTFTKPEE